LICLITEQLQLAIDYLSKVQNCRESITKGFCVRKSPLSEEILSENRYFFSNEKKKDLNYGNTTLVIRL